MKTKYENELRSLQSWINNVNNGLVSGMPIVIDPGSANNTCYQINAVANGIKEEYPIYAKELKNISANLFKNSTYGTVLLNDAAFGKLFIIIHHVVQEPVDMAIWREIHPRIVGICQGLFCDGYYDSAEKTVKEVESRLRELFQILKPGVAVPAKLAILWVHCFQRMVHTSLPICLQQVVRIIAGESIHYSKGFLPLIEIQPLMKIFHVQKGKP